MSKILEIEFGKGVDVLQAVYPRGMTTDRIRTIYENYFIHENYNTDTWIKACRDIGATSKYFPSIAEMKSAYWDAAKEKKIEVTHADCEFCTNGLRSYFKYKGHREDGSRVKYTYCALCDCEAGSQYSQNLKNEKHWATWTEKVKQGKFVQHDSETIPEFIPFTNKYAEPAPF